jgi:hypothetical protein
MRVCMRMRAIAHVKMYRCLLMFMQYSVLNACVHVYWRYLLSASVLFFCGRIFVLSRMTK